MGRDTTAEKLEEDETHQEAGGAAGKAEVLSQQARENKRRSEK